MTEFLDMIQPVAMAVAFVVCPIVIMVGPVHDNLASTWPRRRAIGIGWGVAASLTLLTGAIWFASGAHLIGKVPVWPFVCMAIVAFTWTAMQTAARAVEIRKMDRDKEITP